MTRRGRLAAVAGLVVITAVVARIAFKETFEPEAVLLLLRASRERWWSVPTYVGVYFASTALLMPAIAMHIVAGAVWGFEQGWFVAFLGANAASNAQFFIGRWVGPARVKAWLLARGLSRLVDELERRGAVTMIVIRQLPLPYAAVNMTVGASPMTWPQFVVGNAIGLLPSVTIYTYFSAALAEGVEGARTEALLKAIIAAVAAVVIGLGSRWLMARRD